MSEFHESSRTTTDASALRRAHSARQQRFFIAFALGEGLFLAAAILLIYVLGIVDPEQGLWLLVAIAVVGGTVLSGYLLTTTRSNQRELAALTER